MHHANHGRWNNRYEYAVLSLIFHGYVFRQLSAYFNEVRETRGILPLVLFSKALSTIYRIQTASWRYLSLTTPDH